MSVLFSGLNVVDTFYGWSNIDFADVIVASFLVLCSVSLFTYSLLMLYHLRKILSEGSDHHSRRQMRSLTFFLALFVTLVLVFVIRLVVVCVSQMSRTVFFGHAVYYGVTTTMPEIGGSAVFLYIIFSAYRVASRSGGPRAAEGDGYYDFSCSAKDLSGSSGIESEVEDNGADMSVPLQYGV